MFRWLAKVFARAPEITTAGEERAERQERMVREAIERLSGTAPRNERIERALERALEEAKKEERK